MIARPEDAEPPLRLTEDHYRSMVEATRSAIVCLSPDRRILQWNRGAEQIFGYRAEDVLGRDYFTLFLPEEHRATIGTVFRNILSGETYRNYENPVKTRDGSERTMIWNSSRLLNEHGQLLGVVAIGQDITDLKQAQALQAGENRVLELIAKEGSLSEVLTTLTTTIEDVCHRLRCMVTLVSEDGRRLNCAAAPSLPEELRRGIERLPIGPDSAFCGAAAHRREKVFVEDIKDSPLRTELADAALNNGFRACCSQPILSTQGEVLGTFDAYLPSAGRPQEIDVEHIQTAARLAGIAIENNRAREKRERENEALLQRAEEQLEELRDELRKQFSFEDMVAVSPAMLKVIQMAAKVAPTEATVLITGETGTGKEVLARAIHANSPRAHGPFVAVNCGAIPETLMEAELFGHERGAFTGADRRRAGRIERARGGILFLDEVGELIPAAQVKLLRVLQERTFERLGGTEALPADVRILAATNRDLAADMKKGKFREDLYYRLNVFRIHIPPLRERREAIPGLADRILNRIAGQLGRPEIGLSKPALQLLTEYDWYGNVRELENALERAAILCGGSLIRPEHLPIRSPAPVSDSEPGDGTEMVIRLGQGFSMGTLQENLVRHALRIAKGNQSRAARLLGVSRGSLRWRAGKLAESGQK